MKRTVVLDGGPIGFEDVVAVAHGDVQVELDPSVDERMQPALDVIEQAVDEDRVVYGVTTGFGALANTPIDPSQAAELQVHLLRSHAGGVG